MNSQVRLNYGGPPVLRQKPDLVIGGGGGGGGRGFSTLVSVWRRRKGLEPDGYGHGQALASVGRSASSYSFGEKTSFMSVHFMSVTR